MKKLMMAAGLAAAALAGAAFEARGEGLSAVELAAGENGVPAPCRVVGLHATGTNASGTVTLKRVTTLERTWVETADVTNVTYTTAWSNLTHTVTNDVVSAWRTNTVDGVVVSNLLDRAVNATPSVYPFPDLLIVTNKEEATEVYTNIPYFVESARTVTRQPVAVSVTKRVTNDICTATLSGGFFQTNGVDCLLAPGDVVVGSGTAFDGGRVQLIILR